MQEAVGVADVKEGDALLPDGEHSGVEGEDEAFALLVWGHFGLLVYGFISLGEVELVYFCLLVYTFWVYSLFRGFIGLLVY